MILRPRLLERIKEHEGFSSTVYKDSLGKATVGHGRLLDAPGGISPEEAEMLLRNDLWAAERAAEQFHWFDDLSAPRQEVIIEMIFQLGFAGVSKFRNMISAIMDDDFVLAAMEMKESRWHEQTPGRCEKLAGIMESGSRNSSE